MEYFEDRRIVVGLTKEELTQKLPLTGRRKTCSIRAILYYDPDYVPITRVWVTDPNPAYGAQWLKKIPDSTTAITSVGSALKGGPRQLLIQDYLWLQVFLCAKLG